MNIVPTQQRFLQKSYSRTALLILLTLVLFPSLSNAQSAPADTTSAAETGSPALSARELELQRKEEELLRVMSGLPPSSAPATDSAAPQAQVEAATREPVKKTVTVQTLDVAEPSVITTTTSDDLPHLRALENHPALESPKPRTAPAPSNVPAVRTHGQAHATHSGTAAKIGVYTRVDQEQRRNSYASREVAPTKLVSLDEIEREASVRDMSLSQQELATIRTSSTRLRTGPTSLDSTLMVLPQFSEVSIDYRSGSWYRVRTAAGLRGWVSGSALLFDAGVSLRSAVRVGAVSGNIR